MTSSANVESLAVSERVDSELLWPPPSDPVSDLLRLPFSRGSFGKKTDLISRGRPTPKLDGLTQAGKGFVRHFTECNYSRYDWLTASTVFSSLNSFTKAALKHQASERHLTSVVHLKTFGVSRVDLQLDEQRRRETSLHNERVRKKREILKRLIDCVIFLGPR